MDFVAVRRQAYFEQDNFKIIDTPDAAEPDLAVIYFSSLGTFTPDKTEKRLTEDYYEFHRNPAARAGRHIYVRDVSLALYTAGINHQIHDIDQLLQLLKELTKDYAKIVTVGVCSGGYMAMLAGAGLKAQYVLSFSGLIGIAGFGVYLHREQADSQGYHIGDWVQFDDKYFDIQHQVAESKVPVFQFESVHCTADFANAELLKTLPNVRFFKVDSDRHGGQLNARCVGRLLNLNFEQICGFWQHFDGQIISQWSANLQLLPITDLAAIYLSKLRKNIFKFKWKKSRKLLIILGIKLVDQDL